MDATACNPRLRHVNSSITESYIVPTKDKASGHNYSDKTTVKALKVSSSVSSMYYGKRSQYFRYVGRCMLGMVVCILGTEVCILGTNRKTLHMKVLPFPLADVELAL